MNSQEYITLAKNLHSLILEEVNQREIAQSDEAEFYPKIFIMYEFFRLIRGEAFTNFHEPLGDFQKEMYAMEDEIAEILSKIKNKVNFEDSKSKYYREELLNSFLKK